MRIVQEMTPEVLSHMEIDLVPFKEEEDNDLSPNAIKMLDRTPEEDSNDMSCRQCHQSHPIHTLVLNN